MRGSEMRMGHVQQEIVSLLRGGQTTTVAEITETIQISRGSARSALRALLRRGLVVRSLEHEPGRRGRPGYRWRLAEVEAENDEAENDEPDGA